jgi:hypothetical protein
MIVMIWPVLESVWSQADSQFHKRKQRGRSHCVDGTNDNNLPITQYRLYKQWLSKVTVSIRVSDLSLHSMITPQCTFLSPILAHV